MNFLKFLKITVLMATFLTLRPRLALAQYYGGTEEKTKLILDKKVRWVPNGDSLDNIDKSVKVFYENDVIEYSILIRNGGNTNFSEIELRDYLPKYLSLIFYPGEYKTDSGEIVWKIENLNPGEEKTYLIRGKINETANIGVNSVLQMTNKAEAKVGDIADSDAASYFIGGSSIPETGDIDLLIKSAMVLSTAASGWFLRKYARGY